MDMGGHGHVLNQVQNNTQVIDGIIIIAQLPFIQGPAVKFDGHGFGIGYEENAMKAIQFFINSSGSHGIQQIDE